MALLRIDSDVFGLLLAALQVRKMTRHDPFTRRQMRYQRNPAPMRTITRCPTHATHEFVRGLLEYARARVISVVFWRSERRAAGMSVGSAWPFGGWKRWTRRSLDSDSELVFQVCAGHSLDLDFALTGG